MLLLALPEPKRAKKEAFLLRASCVKFGFNAFSKLIKHIAIALKPLAEEAIPLEWGKEFSELMLILYSRIYGQYSCTLLKNFAILGLNSSFSFPSKNNSNTAAAVFSFLEKSTVVMV